MRQQLSRYKRLIFISATLLALAVTLWETNRFLQEFKQEERAKMELLASAYQKLLDVKDDNPALLNLSSAILEKNHTIPVIIVDKNDKVVFHRNLSKNEPEFIQKKLREFKKTDKHFKLDLGDEDYQILYYGDSSLLSKLTYYPVILVAIFLLFAAIVYLYYHTGKVSDENRLWSGLAKETAHQIGTPLSSLMGWVELLKAENNPDIPVEEIEKDVQRLNVISQRFSKIGSTPKLEQKDVVEITKRTVHYLKSRTSKLVKFTVKAPDKLQGLLNEQLYSWVIENMVKNAIDAMEGKGDIHIEITEDGQHIFVDVSDTGKGIPASKFQQVFQPGYTTKKRGWGLGLSLSKRIIEQYHKGKIFVQKSGLGKGTTFRIVLQK